MAQSKKYSGGTFTMFELLSQVGPALMLREIAAYIDASSDAAWCNFSSRVRVLAEQAQHYQTLIAERDVSELESISELWGKKKG